MPARIHILKGVIKAVAVPVKALGVGGIWNNGIRGYKPPYPCIIIPGPVIVKAGRVKAVAGELFICDTSGRLKAVNGI